MIVDDNKQMREFLKSYFASSENKIFECSNGKEAFENYSLFVPDYVLMDLKMPVMDGVEATHQIVKSFPNAKIVMVTEYDDIHLRDEAKKAGAKGYILKDNLSNLKTFFSIAK